MPRVLSDQKNLLLTGTVLALALVTIFSWVTFGRKPVTLPPPPQEATPAAVSESQKKIMLIAYNDSGETGSATLEERHGKVTVVLDLIGVPEDVPQPTHIHTGFCPTLGAVLYPLNDLVNGKLETTLAVSMDELLERTEPLAINVHASAEDLATYVSCGDIR